MRTRFWQFSLRDIHFHVMPRDDTPQLPPRDGEARKPEIELLDTASGFDIAIRFRIRPPLITGSRHHLTAPYTVTRPIYRREYRAQIYEPASRPCHAFDGSIVERGERRKAGRFDARPARALRIIEQD